MRHKTETLQMREQADHGSGSSDGKLTLFRVISRHFLLIAKLDALLRGTTQGSAKRHQNDTDAVQRTRRGAHLASRVNEGQSEASFASLEISNGQRST